MYNLILNDVLTGCLSVTKKSHASFCEKTTTNKPSPDAITIAVLLVYLVHSPVFSLIKN